MCIRYDISNDQLVIWSKAIGAWVPLDDWLAGNDTFPGYEAPLVILEDRKKQLRIGQWGLIPKFAEKASFGKNYGYNARSEGREDHNDGIENTPSFSEAMRKRRCIIPATAFYERADDHWQRITIRDMDVMGFAGLWEPPRLTARPTFTMVTTVPNIVVAKVQDRMPVILHESDYDRWLDPKSSLVELKRLMVPYPADEFHMEQRERYRRRAYRFPCSSKNEASRKLVDKTILVRVILLGMNVSANLATGSPDIIRRVLPEPTSSESSYLESKRDEIEYLARKVSWNERKGLCMVSMPMEGAEDLGDPGIAILKRDLCVPEYFRQAKLDEEEFGIHSALEDDEVEEVCGLVAQGCPESEMWVLLAAPSLSGLRYSVTRFFVGISDEVASIQTDLFSEALVRLFGKEKSPPNRRA